MKNLLLIRHAKSSWSNLALSDFDRPLNDRGKHDAPMMAKRMADRKVFPDLLVSSTANRAITTARMMCDALKYKPKHIKEVPDLYHASPETFASVISSLPNEHDTIALYSHNPGITHYCNQLGVASLDNMPTCGVFAVHAITDDWSGFAEAEKRFWFFDFPKNG